MTNEEMIKKFKEIQKMLWDCARNGNMMQSIIATNLIQECKILSPEGDLPEES